MPWSNQTGGGSNGSGGPWGSGKKNDGPKNQGPWGGGQNGGGDNTPDLEDLIRRSQDRLKQVLPGGGGSGGLGGTNPVLIGFAALAILGFVLYNFFTFRVEPEQQGVVLRFGEMHRTTQP